jgi:hypothetical protein
MSYARGVYEKFQIRRTDGDPTGKHKQCTYFVLDLDHDENALPALRAYAKSCKKNRPQLYKDLKWLIDLASGPKGEFFPVSLGSTMRRALGANDE